MRGRTRRRRPPPYPDDLPHAVASPSESHAGAGPVSENVHVTGKREKGCHLAAPACSDRLASCKAMTGMSVRARPTATHDPAGATSGSAVPCTAPWLRRLLVPAVVVILITLVVVPILVERREDRLHSRISELVVPARSLLAETEIDLARMVAVSRAYLIGRDPRELRRLGALLEQRAAHALPLTRLARRLGPEIARREAEFRRREELWTSIAGAMVVGRLPPGALVETIDVGQERFEAILQAAAELDRGLAEVEARLRGEIEQLRALERLLVVVLSLAALGILAVVLWLVSRLASLTRDLRYAADNAARRAREEAALRKATESVTAAQTVETTLPRIAEGALAATAAIGAFVERVETAERLELEVVAVAGDRVPVVGGRVPYDGSVGKRTIERGRPEVLPDLSEYQGSTLPRLVAACRHCALLVVPLRGAGQAIGVLVLLRGPDQPPFRPDEIQVAQTFADLAGLAFRKVHLLEETQRRREELERIVASRERLMRGFSHDVKNPLGAADGHLQLLEEGVVGDLEPKQAESVRRSRDSIRSALELIEALVGLARAEAGGIELESEPLDVREIARGAAEEYRAQAEAAGLSIDIELPDELPVIDSDGSRIRQILGNLLSNAVKYTERGEVTVTVGTRAGGRAPGPGRWVVVSISDTGRGIPEAQQRRLFQEFHRIEPGPKTGAGLGLAISQRLARLLGGAITVDSAPGVGSTFTLWLSLADEARSPEEERRREAA